MYWPIATTNYLNLSSQTVKLLVVLLSKDTFAAHCPPVGVEPAELSEIAIGHVIIILSVAPQTGCEPVTC